MVPGDARRLGRQRCLARRPHGPSIDRDNIVEAIARIVEVYLEQRYNEDESFLQCYRRVGMVPFKTRIYAQEAEPA